MLSSLSFLLFSNSFLFCCPIDESYQYSTVIMNVYMYSAHVHVSTLSFKTAPFIHEYSVVSNKINSQTVYLIYF